MENEKLNVAEEMQKLEFEIGKASSDLTVEELKDVKVIEKGEPLFMRKNLEEELEYLRN